MSGPKRRPRRSNSSKTLHRELSTACTAYESRQDRLKEKAQRISDTDGCAQYVFIEVQTANLFLRDFGVQVIANDCVIHMYEEWPGMD
jgi:hypothetical protein